MGTFIDNENHEIIFKHTITLSEEDINRLDFISNLLFEEYLKSKDNLEHKESKSDRLWDTSKIWKNIKQVNLSTIEEETKEGKEFNNLLVYLFEETDYSFKDKIIILFIYHNRMMGKSFLKDLIIPIEINDSKEKITIEIKEGCLLIKTEINPKFYRIDKYIYLGPGYITLSDEIYEGISKRNYKHSIRRDLIYTFKEHEFYVNINPKTKTIITKNYLWNLLESEDQITEECIFDLIEVYLRFLGYLSREQLEIKQELAIDEITIKEKTINHIRKFNLREKIQDIISPVYDEEDIKLDGILFYIMNIFEEIDNSFEPIKTNIKSDIETDEIKLNWR